MHHKVEIAHDHLFITAEKHIVSPTVLWNATTLPTKTYVTRHSGAFFCIDSVVQLKPVACITLSTLGIITITDFCNKLKDQTLPCYFILNVQW